MGDPVRTEIVPAKGSRDAPSTATHKRSSTVLSTLILVALTLLVHAQSVGFGFVPYDDALNVTENPHFAVVGAEDLKQFWLKPLHKLYIPITYILWAGLAKVAQYGLSGDGYHLFYAAPFHAINVLLHLCNALWVAAILRCFIGRELVVLIASALFAVHPIMAEPVAWVTGLKDVLFGFFALPALWCSIRSGRSDRRQTTWIIGATCLYAAALMAKPAALALPVILAVVGLYEHWSRRRIAVILLGWMGLGLPVIMMTWTSQAANSTAAVAWASRILVAADALTFYVAKVIVPFPLLIDYGATPNFVLGKHQIWFALIFVAGISLWLWRQRDKRWWLAAGIAVAGLAPVLGFIPFEFQSHSTVADRYMYLPMLGISLAAAWMLERMGRKGLSVAFAALLVMTLVGFRQVRVWSSADALFSHTLERKPGSLVAWQSLGAGYMAARRWNEAVNSFTAALALRPRFGDGLYNLGLAYEELGLNELALEQFVKIASSGAPTAVSLEGAARCAKRLGQWEDAKQFVLRAEHEFPGRPQAAWLMAEILTHTGDLKGAEDSFRMAIGRQPNGYELRTAYADFLSDHGDPNAAVAEYLAAVKLAPEVAPPRINLAALLASMGRVSEAEAQLQEAIRLNPNIATAYVNYGFLLEKSGRLVDASAAFQTALRLEPGRADAQLGWARVQGGGS